MIFFKQSSKITPRSFLLLNVFSSVRHLLKGMQKEFLRETRLLADEVIMVGDSMADIESGNKIGMTTVAVLTGPLGRSELEKKADIVLNSISEIPSLLQKL